MANPQKENGHINIATEIAEVLAQTQLSGYESRILWALWRKTWGWAKKEKGKYVRDKNGNIVKLKKAPFSSEDWIKLTGLNIKHVYRTLRRLKKRNIIIKFNKNTWGFQKNYDEWLPLKSTKNGTNEKIEKVPKLATKSTKNGTKISSNSLEQKEIQVSKEKKENNNIIYNNITNSNIDSKYFSTYYPKPKFPQSEKDCGGGIKPPPSSSTSKYIRKIERDNQKRISSLEKIADIWKEKKKEMFNAR